MKISYIILLLFFVSCNKINDNVRKTHFTPKTCEERLNELRKENRELKKDLRRRDSVISIHIFKDNESFKELYK